MVSSVVRMVLPTGLEAFISSADRLATQFLNAAYLVSRSERIVSTVGTFESEGVEPPAKSATSFSSIGSLVCFFRYRSWVAAQWANCQPRWARPGPGRQARTLVMSWPLFSIVASSSKRRVWEKSKAAMRVFLSIGDYCFLLGKFPPV